MSRFIDRGAIAAGWIGAGMALVIVIAFGLIIGIQPLVIIAAVPVGVAIGAYANVRSHRRGPAWRLIANSGWAGLITGVTIAAAYLGIRLLFLYADTGIQPDGTRLGCRPGPECVYAREIAAGQGPALAAEGITDVVEFERQKLAVFAEVGGLLVVLSAGGALIAGGVQVLAARSRPRTAEEETPA